MSEGVGSVRWGGGGVSTTSEVPDGGVGWQGRGGAVYLKTLLLVSPSPGVIFSDSHED